MRTAQNYKYSVSNSTPEQLLQASFRRYFRSFQHTYEPAEWYNLFRVEVYAILKQRFGLSIDQTEYMLRSDVFVDFAHDLQGVARLQRTMVV